LLTILSRYCVRFVDLLVWRSLGSEIRLAAMQVLQLLIVLLMRIFRKNILISSLYLIFRYS